MSFDFPSEVVQNGVIQLVLHLQNQSDLELSAEVFPKLTDDFMWVGKSRVICSLPPQVSNCVSLINLLENRTRCVERDCRKRGLRRLELVCGVVARG